MRQTREAILYRTKVTIKGLKATGRQLKRGKIRLLCCARATVRKESKFNVKKGFRCVLGFKL